MPGHYHLLMDATRGTARGRRINLDLFLLAYSGPNGGQAGYGWIVGNLEATGAPICPDAPAPKPNSQDPLAPGVLVEYQSTSKGREYLLLVSTVKNLLATDSHTLDGCGIGLWIEKLSDTRFSGRWDRWGIMANGKGRFSATLSKDQPNNSFQRTRTPAGSGPLNSGR